ncbi:MAG: hypothetical protein H8E46_08305 [FCB group bacterium]|nr:hypothetical protein [FCB group bacterium]
MKKQKAGLMNQTPTWEVSMKYDPDKHHRRSIRLKEYDYSLAAWYFVTILTRQRIEYFGKIISFMTELNTCGHIVQDNLSKIPDINSNSVLDEYVIMPNHLHAIVGLLDTGDRKGLIHQTPVDNDDTNIVLAKSPGPDYESSLTCSVAIIAAGDRKGLIYQTHPV